MFLGLLPRYPEHSILLTILSGGWKNYGVYTFNIV